MRALVALPCALTLMFATARVACSPRVIVLEPRPPGVEAWPRGQQAVVAELSASGFDLVLRQSRSESVEQLSGKLLDAAQEAEALGALAVVRKGSIGLVLVTTAHSGLVRIEVPAPSAVAEGYAALRVAELLRTLQVPAREAAAEQASPAASGPVSSQAKAARHHSGELWADTGIALSSDLGKPMLVVGAGGALRIWSYVSAELSVRLMPTRTRIDTAAGAVDLRGAQTTLHVAFSPATTGALGFTLGLGGGALALDESAAGAAGFRGRSDRTWAPLLSARARGVLYAGSLVASLMIEPGLTLPPITIHAAESELARLGRPWACMTLGLGFEL